MTNIKALFISIKNKIKTLSKMVGEVISLKYGDAEDTWYTVVYHPLFSIVLFYLLCVFSRVAWCYVEDDPYIDAIGKYHYPAYYVKTHKCNEPQYGWNDRPSFDVSDYMEETIKLRMKMRVESREEAYSKLCKDDPLFKRETLEVYLANRAVEFRLAEEARKAQEFSLAQSSRPTAPVEPRPTTPLEPIPTAPVEPRPTTPLEPIPTAPVKPAGATLHFDTFMATYGKLMEGKNDMKDIVTASLKFVKTYLPSEYIATHVEQLGDEKHPANVLVGFLRDLYVDSSDPDTTLISGLLLTSVLTHVTFNVEMPEYDLSNPHVYNLYIMNLKKFGVIG